MRNFAALMKTDSLHKTLSNFKKADLVDILYYIPMEILRGTAILQGLVLKG